MSIVDPVTCGFAKVFVYELFTEDGNGSMTHNYKDLHQRYLYIALKLFVALVSYDLCWGGEEILFVDFRFILYIVVFILEVFWKWPYTITTPGILRFFLENFMFGYVFSHYMFLTCKWQKIFMTCQFNFLSKNDNFLK